MDPSSFQPIFYFLVIKASITLVVTPLVLAFAPVSNRSITASSALTDHN
jgi:hypothetical protein